MSGDAFDKRFKVVQDAWGVWGILDTVALEFGMGAFAGWGGVSRVHSFWLSEIVRFAAKLNAGTQDKYTFDWDEYTPREVAGDRIPV
ncbi:hypothetical protein SEA_NECROPHOXINUS_111 [Microbacterium phage Necrophoxinus]|nr:hypothetical protein SEA_NECROPHOXINUS_111 [Microbacterium phage Necrophoxinus]